MLHKLLPLLCLNPTRKRRAGASLRSKCLGPGCAAAKCSSERPGRDRCNGVWDVEVSHVMSRLPKPHIVEAQAKEARCACSLEPQILDTRPQTRDWGSIWDLMFNFRHCLIWGFPKIRGTLFWGPLLGSPIFGNSQKKALHT